ncbi:PAS domain-containing protein [Pontitalea aquivivens]|uniref:PAS domain-containing protein n=1 Tax=Pontitalea aquivivens TaxID=3388663 RepID=UPI003970B088
MTRQGSGTARRAVAELRAYWEALRRGRLVPARTDVNPRGIERSLEYAFILERVAPGVARFRLAGTHLTDLMGMEVRGMPLGALFVPAGRQRLADALETVFQGPAVAELSLAAETGIGKPPLAARLLLLPLKSDLGDITRALGCLVAEGEIGRRPRRFAISGAEMTPLSSEIPQLEPAPRDRAPCAPVAGLAEPPAPQIPDPAMTPELRRALLRVVRAED